MLAAWILVSALLPPENAGARSSNACFSRGEVRQMVQKRETVSRTAASCLQAYWDTHQSFHAENRYSKYFGNRNEAIDTEDERGKIILLALWRDLPRALEGLPPGQRRVLRDARGLKEFERTLRQLSPAIFSEYERLKDGFNLKERVRDEMDVEMNAGRKPVLLPNDKIYLQNISCVDMTRRCLAEGFRKAGMAQTWAKIDKEVRANGVSGVELQKALGDLGWTTLYWNPDISRNKAWDEEDRAINPLKPPAPGKRPPVWNGSWGAHAERWNAHCRPDGTLAPGKRAGGVRCTDMYELGAERAIPIDDKVLLVNFGTEPPAAFAKVPFFVGTAHSGYHVFPGFYGKVIEAHSMRALSSVENLEVGGFNPLAQEAGGSPRWTNSEKYRSGVIAVPPGYLKALPPAEAPESEGCVDLKPVNGK